MNNLSKARDYFPASSHALLAEMCSPYEFVLKLRQKRLTKLGDFRYPRKGEIPIITVNKDMNSYHFLFIFLHEFAHLLVWKSYGKKVKPHGQEWKNTFADVLRPYIEMSIFPEDLTIALRKFADNPRATSFADTTLVALFRSYDAPDDPNITTLENIPQDITFRLENGRSFTKVKKMRSRFLCKEEKSGRLYLIHGQARVLSLP